MATFSSDSQMNRPHAPAHFFGLDLRQLKSDWLVALRQIANWPVLGWLTPVYATRVRLFDGEIAYLTEDGGRLAPGQVSTKKVAFSGFLLPEHLVLWRRVVLPELGVDETLSAIGLEAKRLSPFLPEDSVWSHTPPTLVPGGRETHLVLASRKATAEYVASLDPNQVDFERVEIWVETPELQHFLVLNGFGEKVRRRFTDRDRIVNFGLVLLMACSAFAGMVTPTVQLHLRARHAEQAYTTLQSAVAPVLKQREFLVKLDQQVKALQNQLAQSTEPEPILLQITKLLTDDTYLSSLQVQGERVSLVGQTPNTAALMQHLGAQAGIKDVKAPVAAVKQRGAEREAFTIEFVWDTSNLTVKP